jgi:hypothetical protein
LNGGQESFWVFPQILNRSGGAAATVNQLPEASPSKGNDSDFRPREDAANKDQGEDDEDVRNGGSTPLEGLYPGQQLNGGALGTIHNWSLQALTRSLSADVHFRLGLAAALHRPAT